METVVHRPLEAPGPSGFLSGWPLMREPILFLEKIFQVYGDIVRLRILNLCICSIAHPVGIKHVLQDNHRNYKKSFDYKILARLLGQGLVTSEGSLWLKQRRLMQPMFHRQKVMEFGTLMADCTLAGCGKRYLEGASHTAIATYDAPTLANITE
jgi:cytochrome P450